MLSAKYKYAALALGVMFIALVFNASAQWSPGGAMVYMGDQVPANNSSLNNSSINATSIDNSTLVGPSIVVPSAVATESSDKKILDLSGYARDRTNKNLTGYKNIMYPISGSRGSTTSTAGGGGGCGCG